MNVTYLEDVSKWTQKGIDVVLNRMDAECSFLDCYGEIITYASLISFENIFTSK